VFYNYDGLYEVLKNEMQCFEPVLDHALQFPKCFLRPHCFSRKLPQETENLLLYGCIFDYLYHFPMAPNIRCVSKLLKVDAELLQRNS
jgi:hypothetical protein